MAGPEFSDDTYSIHDVGMFLREGRDRNPEFFQRIIERFWESSTQDEQEAVKALQSMLAPGDPRIKNLVVMACMLYDYMLSDDARSDMLEAEGTLRHLQEVFRAPAFGQDGQDAAG